MAEVLTLVVVVAASTVGTGLWCRLSRRYRLLDIPNERSSHASPVPRGGGTAIVVTFIGALTFLWLAASLPRELFIALALGGGAVAAVGLIDDYARVSPAWRLLVHLGAAALAVALCGPIPELLPDDVEGEWRSALLVAMTLGIVWHTNLFNFMDGIDGIAASQSFFITFAAALIAWLSGHFSHATVLLCLAAATLGFMFWNWPPAKVFMGDVGSGFLGFALAVLAMFSAAAGLISVWTWLILMSAFVADATATLVRRMLRMERVYEAHRSHAYQRLARQFDSHRKVTLGFLMLNALWAFPLALASVYYPHSAPYLAGVALLPLFVLASLLGAGKRETT